MGLFKSGLKFLAEHLASNVLSSAGSNIGEAIGKRLGSKIYTPPPVEPEKGESNESEECPRDKKQ